MITYMYDKKIAKIAVIGGDMRSLAAAWAMSERGIAAAVWGFDKDATKDDVPRPGGSIIKCTTVCEAVSGADAIVLPLPVSGDGIRLNCPQSSRELKLCDLFGLLSGDVPIFGGLVSEDVKKRADEHGLTITDYYDRDELCILNAVPTAEGAVAIAINELPITLSGADTVVLGFGRVARVLCRTLRALGANVTACARKPADFAWMRTMDIKPADITLLESQSEPSGFDVESAGHAVSRADVVFNTVPSKLLTYPVLGMLKTGVPVIDLASKPGGVDFDAARQLGVNVIWALSLPGKTAPESAGRIICSTVLGILAENGGML